MQTADGRPRAVVFAALDAVELTVRDPIGRALGDVIECAQLIAQELNARAGGTESCRLLSQYEKAIPESCVDFAERNQAKYSGTLPMWAAVELLDRDGLRHLAWSRG